MNRFRGINGTLILTSNSVLVLRERGIDNIFHDYEEIEIPFSNISDVKVALGSVINGYISIIEIGNHKPSGIFKAMKDEHTIIFRMFKNTAAERFAKLIRAQL